MKENNLTSIIKSIPENNVPEDFSLKVMAGLSEPDKSFLEKLTDLLSHRVTISFAPIKATCIVILLLTGFLFYNSIFAPQKNLNTADMDVYPIKDSSFYFMSRTEESIAAWKNYLKIKQTGSWALTAVNHLNYEGDFTYRISRIGKQKMVLGPFSRKHNNPETIISDSILNKLGRSLNINPDMDLYIISYADKDPKIAEKHAKAIKIKILNIFPEISSTRIKLSWFGTSDKVKSGDKSFSLEQSVRFLGLDKGFLNKGVNT